MIFLILPALGPLLPAIIKGAGGLAAYIASRAAIRRQNRYNLPENQVARLRRAGVPLAASKYFENTQQGLEDTSGLQFGAEGLSGYIDTQQTIQEISKADAETQKIYSEMLKIASEIGKNDAEIQKIFQDMKKSRAEIRKIKAEEAKTWADKLISDTKGKLDLEISKWLTDTEALNAKPLNNLTKNMLADQNVKLADLAGKTFANKLSEVQAELMEDLQDDGLLKEEWIAKMNTIIKDLEIKNLVWENDNIKLGFIKEFLTNIEEDRKAGNINPDSFMSRLEDLATMIILGAGNLHGFKP